MRPFFRRLSADRAGNSLVEMALVMPILLTLFAGMADFGLGFAKRVKTQQAAARAAELAGTIGIDGVSNSTVLQTEAATAAGVPTSSVSVSLTLVCVTSANVRTTQSDFSGYCPTGDETARYASVTVNNTYTPFLAALLPHSLSASKVFSFAGKSTVRMQ